jgi:hypothetical protein
LAELPPSYVFLDGASAVLTLLVALGFWWVSRWTRQALHVLLSAGFTAVAAGFLLVSLSHFSDALTFDIVDGARLVLQLAGALLLAGAYAAHHLAGRPRAAAVVFASLAVFAALLALVWLLPPAGQITPLPEYFALAHTVMAACYFGCALLSGYGWHRRPTWGRAMVPFGFLAWALSTYTWIFIDLSPGDDTFLPVVYFWRFVAVLLMIWAMVRRPRYQARGPDAEA